jgi:hypothetical protein
MFIKITNDGLKKYTIGQLRQDNPNVSFPKEIPLETLAEYNVYPCTLAETPDYNNATQYITKGIPVEVNGAWIQPYDVHDYTAEELEGRELQEAKEVRRERNKLLKESDWTQIPDCTVDKTVWATYRQALRDITSQEGFPFNVIFPTKPE